MKKAHLILSAAIFFAASLLVSSCGSAEKKQEAPVQSREEYQCPMKCTEEVFEKAGTCPVCGMDLEKVINS